MAFFIRIAQAAAFIVCATARGLSPGVLISECVTDLPGTLGPEA